MLREKLNGNGGARTDNLATATDTPEPASSRPCRHGRGLHATLTANKPARSGSQRDDLYLYDVELEGETLVSNSRVPECNAARVLLARGITGALTLCDGKTGRPRTIIDIEKAAKLTVLENERSGPRFIRWRPRPQIGADTNAVPATAAEETKEGPA
jgi:hypothetical protein